MSGTDIGSLVPFAIFTEWLEQVVLSSIQPTSLDRQTV